MREYFRYLAEPIGAPELDLLSHLKMKGSPGLAEQAFVKRISNQGVLEDAIVGVACFMYEIERLSGGKRFLRIAARHCRHEDGIEPPADHGRSLQHRTIAKREAIYTRVQQRLHTRRQHAGGRRCVELEPIVAETDDRAVEEEARNLFGKKRVSLCPLGSEPRQRFRQAVATQPRLDDL
jgi:hypothetical protein